MSSEEIKGYTLGESSKDKQTRMKKAGKIINILLSEEESLKNLKALEFGTGSGYIANLISGHVKELYSVDIVDDRIMKKGYKQYIVDDEKLPFADNTFDIAISNQVLEHLPNQELHFKELNRVLKPGALVYLATPNKYWITDPHYKLPFISWLPRRIADIYLRILKKRKWDIFSVSLIRLRRLAKKNNFTVNDKFGEIIMNPDKYTVNVPRFLSKIWKLTPHKITKAMLHIIPTHVKVLRLEKKQS